MAKRAERKIIVIGNMDIFEKCLATVIVELIQSGKIEMEETKTEKRDLNDDNII